MRAVTLVAFVMVFALVSVRPAAAAGERKSGVLVSPPLSINPNDGQPLCLVSNLSATATVPVTIEIVDASGTAAVTYLTSIGPGAVDATTDRLTLFYSYCRITPQDPAQLPLLRGSHCIASGNTARTCLEAR